MQFIDLKTQYVRIEQEIKCAVLDVIDSGNYILGSKVAEFEEQISKYVGTKHAIACANGTDALLMPLMARGIGLGDAVFCPSFTFAATAEVIALTKASPVFIDIEEESYNIDVNQLEKAIKATQQEGILKPKAIIAVDLFGLAANYKALEDIAERYGLFLIEDAAQAMGGKSEGRMCGSFGHVGSTSFYPAKPLGCYGDGGAMFTNDDQLASVLRSLLFHGKGDSQYDTVRIGLNSRLDTIQAAILLEKLKIFEDEIHKRTAIGVRYTEGLYKSVKTPIVKKNMRSVYAQYTIQVDKRDALKAFLNERSIPTAIYYPKPLHLQEAYKKYPIAPGGLPVSEKLSERVISLPMHPYLSREDQKEIIEAIQNFYA